MNRSANRGKLDAVRLLEVLAMLGRQQRSGSLTLQSRDETVTLAIIRGSVRSVSTNDPALRIGQVLIQLELTTEEQIEQALALQSIATDPERIGEVLVDVGYITEGDVGTAMATQIASALGIMLNEERPSFEFNPWNQPPDGMIQPAIVHDPLVLTVLFLAEHWLERTTVGRRGFTSQSALDDIDGLDLDPEQHPIHQRLTQLYEAVCDIRPSLNRQEVERIRRVLASIIEHVQTHEIPVDSSTRGQAGRDVRLRYRVVLLDREIDIWTLTDLTRAARQVMLLLLNGEDRLEALLAEIRPYTTQPDRAVRELSSAGLIEITPDQSAVNEEESQQRRKPDRTMVLRFLP